MLTKYELSAQRYGFPGPYTPMIGREQALTSLQELLYRTRQINRGQIGLIVGEAGLGKSRLITEFCQIDQTAGMKSYFSRCLEYAQVTPYSVIADLLRDIFNISATQPAPFQYKILETFIDHISLQRQEILPYLVNLFGLELFDRNMAADLGHLDTTMLQRQTHVAVRRVLKRQAQHRPLILILEDLQWLDSASSELLAYLLRNLDDMPILFLLTTNDRENELLQSLIPTTSSIQDESTSEQWTTDESPLDELITDDFATIELSPLSLSEGYQLVEQLIPLDNSDATILKRQIVQWAKGNPFYIEELVRFAVDSNVLVGTSSHWKITDAIDDFLNNIPDSLAHLITARVKCLSGVRVQILYQAAVLGRSFSKGLIQGLNQIRFDTAITLLAELVDRQFLTFDLDGLEESYTFQHSLTHQTIYKTIPSHTRQNIHTTVAETIEQSYRGSHNDQTETLAYQYYHSETPERARPYLIMAAESAARRSANLTVIQYYRMVLDLYPENIEFTTNEHSDEFFNIQIGLGRSLKFIGDFTEGTQILQKTLKNIHSHGPIDEKHQLLPELINCLRELADIQIREGDYNKAMAYLNEGLQAINSSTSHAHRRLRRLLMDRQAWVNFRTGELQHAIDISCAATLGTDSEQKEDQALLANLYNTLGGICWQQGKLSRAIKFVELSRRLYREFGYSWGVAVAYINLGVLNVSQGDWLKAVSIYRQTLDILEEVGNIEHRALVLGNLGDVTRLLGDHEAAQRYQKESLLIRQRLGDSWGLSYCHANLAHLALVQRHFDEAEYYVKKAIVLAKELKNTEYEVYSSWILALVQAERYGISTGLETVIQALQRAQSAGLVEKEAECLRVAGMLYAQIGQMVQAEVHLQESIQLCKQLKDRYREGLAYIELSRIHLQSITDQPASKQISTHIAQAQSDLNEAISIFESVGAAYDLKMAKQILSQLNQTRHAIQNT